MVRTTRGIKRSDQFPRDRDQRRTAATAHANYAVVVDHLRAGITSGR